MSSGNKYHRDIYQLKQYNQQGMQLAVKVDVYSVLTAFNVTSPGLQHAIKKLLCAGIREKGSRLQDLKEARDALDRAIEDEEREANYNNKQAKIDDQYRNLWELISVKPVE